VDRFKSFLQTDSLADLIPPAEAGGYFRSFLDDEKRDYVWLGICLQKRSEISTHFREGDYLWFYRLTFLSGISDSVQRPTTSTMSKQRPLGVIALVTLFAVGTCASLISAVSLMFPGSFLEPIWQLNPHAREGFSHIGAWAIMLMLAVCVACALTAIGLWRGCWWGYWLAVLMLLTNLAADLINVITGSERRAIAGIPVVLFILAYLLRNEFRDRFQR
jgi:hypothetical protein